MDDLCARLRELAQDCIDKHLTTSAIFYADKLVTFSNDSPGDVYLLAQAYYAARQYHRALSLLRAAGVIELGAEFTYLAGCCLAEAGEWEEVVALLGDDEAVAEPHAYEDQVLEPPGGGAGVRVQAGMCCLRGRAAEALENRARAAVWYRAALQMDPYCYDAFSALVDGHLLTNEAEVELVAGLQDRLAEGDRWLGLLMRTRCKKYLHPEAIEAALQELEAPAPSQEAAEGEAAEAGGGATTASPGEDEQSYMPYSPEAASASPLDTAGGAAGTSSPLPYMTPLRAALKGGGDGSGSNNATPAGGGTAAGGGGGGGGGEGGRAGGQTRRGGRGGSRRGPRVSSSSPAAGPAGGGGKDASRHAAATGDDDSMDEATAPLHQHQHQQHGHQHPTRGGGGRLSEAGSSPPTSQQHPHHQHPHHHQQQQQPGTPGGGGSEAGGGGGGGCGCGLGGNIDVVACRAELLFHRGDYEAAYSLTRSVLSAGRDPYALQLLPVHIAAAAQLAGAGAGSDPRTDLFLLGHRLTEEHPDLAVSWYAVGCYYLAAHQPEAARRYLGKATQLQRGFAPAWLAYGHAFSAQDERDQAMSAYRTAARLFPGLHTPHLGLGAEYCATANLPLAERALLTAYDICPDDPAVCHELGVLMYKIGQTAAAAMWLDRVLQLLPGGKLTVHWEATLVALGHCMRKLCRFAAASECYSAALALAPASSGTLAALGYVAQLAGDPRVAVEHYHAALALRPDDPFTADMLRLALQEYAEAAAAAEEAAAGGSRGTGTAGGAEAAVMG